MSTFVFTLGGNVTCSVEYELNWSNQGAMDYDPEANILMVTVANQTNAKGQPSDPEDACILEHLNAETVARMEEAAIEHHYESAEEGKYG